MSAEELPDHSEKSPSSAEGWTTCPDYINANRGLPDITSYVAAEGTHAHHIRNDCLTQGYDAAGAVGETMKVGDWTFEWTEEDAFLLQRGIDHVRSYEGTLYGEHWVDLTEWLGFDSHGRRQGGTLDVGIVGDGFYVVNDLKWGRGIPVRAPRNKQLMLYALGFGREHGVTDPSTVFHIEIDQPRRMGGGGSWSTIWGELLAFGEWIKTVPHDSSRVASWPGCLWCRQGGNWAVGNPKCATYDRFVLDALRAEFDDLELKMPTELTPQQRAVIAENKSAIELWLAAIVDQTKHVALSGGDAGGLKAVNGPRNPSKWRDRVAAEAVLKAALGEKGFTKQLITPTQASKKVSSDDLDWLLIEPLIEWGQPRVELAPEEDERPSITSGAEFEDLD
jgi:hypothetical protein